MINIDEFKKMSYSDINKISYEKLEEFFNKNNDLVNKDLVVEKNSELLLNYIKDLEIRIKCLLELNIDDNKKNYYLYDILLFAKNDELIVKYLNNFSNNHYKTIALLLVQNKRLKLQNIDKLDTLNSKVEVIRSINDDKYLLYFIKTSNEEFKLKYVLGLHSDSNKQMFLYDNKGPFEIGESVMIIESLKDNELKYRYALKPLYSNYKERIISTIKDVKYIVYYCNTCKDDKSKVKLIKYLSGDLKDELIKTLNSSLYNYVTNTNNSNFKNNVISKIDDLDIKYDIDKEITIGIELESCSKEYLSMLLLDKMFVDWNIKEESSLDNGIEITSPKITFNEERIKELYYICNFLKKYGFYTTNKCGGHIHLGCSYFNTIEEYKILLNIFCNCEDVLTYISNRKGSKQRAGAKKFAKSIRPIMSSVSKLNINYEKIKTISDYSLLIKERQTDKWYALNSNNIGINYNTIEFRLPNGEIEFKELIYNIRLYTKLFEAVKKIAKGDKDLISNYTYITSFNLRNSEKLSILLNMLFNNEEDKKVYYERYKKNKDKRKIFNKQKVIKL